MKSSEVIFVYKILAIYAKENAPHPIFGTTVIELKLRGKMSSQRVKPFSVTSSLACNNSAATS